MKRDAVTWLDFRSDELSEARAFIRSLQEEGVIDELGFLVLLGRFSDLLHPATTTLMRSARYFYFVAGIYGALERDETRANEVFRLSRGRQDELREVLAGTERTGFIGEVAGRDLKQFPSQIYWSGLRKLGMFTSDLSETAYQAQFDDIRRWRRGFKDDDDALQDAERARHWDKDIPAASFLDERGRVEPLTDFKLTKAEASDLCSRFKSRFPKSLLSHMLEHRLDGIKLPWDCPKLPNGLAIIIRHAENMSLMVRGATLQYYALLVEEREKLGIETAGDIVRPIFEVWWAAAKAPLKAWRTSEFATVPTIASGLRAGIGGDLWFIDGWLARLAVVSTASELLHDDVARKLIRIREGRVKPAKARLKYSKHLRQWKSDRVKNEIHQFDYRHRIGSRFVDEILEGLERGK